MSEFCLSDIQEDVLSLRIERDAYKKHIAELELKIKKMTQHLEPQSMTALFEQVEAEVKQEQKIKELGNACKETQELLDKQIEATYKLDKENSELKSDNDARKFAMAMSEKVEKQLRAENAELKERLTAIRNAKDKYDMSKDKSTIKAFGAEYTLFCDLERILEDWQEDDKLTKAKEIIKSFLNADSELDMINAQRKAEQFLNSEVEK